MVPWQPEEVACESIETFFRLARDLPCVSRWTTETPKVNLMNLTKNLQSVVECEPVKRGSFGTRTHSPSVKSEVLRLGPSDATERKRGFQSEHYTIRGLENMSWYETLPIAPSS